MLDEVLDAHLDHLRLGFKHGDHFHDFWHKVVVLVSLVGLHDRDNLTVDYGTTLPIDVVVLLNILISHLAWSFLSDTRWNKIHTQSLTSELHVEGNSFSVTFEDRLLNFLQQNLYTRLAKSN